LQWADIDLATRIMDVVMEIGELAAPPREGLTHALESDSTEPPRACGAHGYFEADPGMARYTVARFLRDPAVRTPVFVRFASIFRGGEVGEPDTAAFAVKFYTTDGMFDLVGGDLPDRAVPRSYRMMEAFAAQTFRFEDERGARRFVRFHWRPRLGVHSLHPIEARRIAEKDPHFHRRDLWDAIAQGNFPELELFAQISSDPDPAGRVERVGRIVLDRNPDSFFAQVDQAAFHAGHVVDGIEATTVPGTSDRSVALFHRAALGTDLGIEAAGTRKVAILAADGVDLSALQAMQEALREVGAVGKIVAKRIGILTGADGRERLIDHSLLTTSSVLFDAVYVPGGSRSVAALVDDPDAVAFVAEAYAHGKAIAASDDGLDLLRACGGDLAASNGDRPGVLAGPASKALADGFVEAIAAHRHRR
jgi:putative intracellular protease/amidase